MNGLDEQNQLRLKTCLRTLKEAIDLLAERSPDIAQRIRESVYVPSWNLQVAAKIPLDDIVEICP